MILDVTRLNYKVVYRTGATWIFFFLFEFLSLSFRTDSDVSYVLTNPSGR